MALYDFACTGCGQRFEHFADPHASDKRAVCPECGAEARRRFTTFRSPESFGHNSYVNRTPAWRQRLKDDEQASHARDLRVAAGAGSVFGQMPGRKDLATA